MMARTRITFARCRLFAALLVNIAVLFSASLAEAQGQTSLRDFVRVVIADTPSSVEKVAADELRHYIGLISGRDLEVTSVSRFDRTKSTGKSFFVGRTAAELALGEPLGRWKTEEYLLRSVPLGVALAGDDGAGSPWSSQTATGTMLAVYTLLDDHLGTRWFWPGEFGEHVPRQPDAVVPALNERRTPTWEIRSVGLGYSAYHTPTFGTEARRWAKRNRLGWVRSAVFGHSWDAAFDLRKGETFRQHPEWFALVNGERRPPQMCTTHPEVIQRMVDHVLNGSQTIMNISPSDGGGFCQCDRCQALDVPGLLSYDKKHVQLSDRIFTYANEVARRVRAKNPDKGCGMFAYTYYNRPPVKIERLEPNLYLSFVFQSAAHRDPENLREWRESVAGWQKLGAKMVVREGWGNHYYHDLPMLHSRQIINNLAEAHRLGFVGAYGEGSKSFATMAPNNWAIARMLWNPARDTSRLMPDYYESAYGPVAVEMRSFFEAYEQSLDENWSRRDRVVDTSGIAYANVIGAWNRLLTPAAVETAEKHLQAAEKKVPAGEYANRVAFHRFGHDYSKVMLGLLDSYARLSELGVPLKFSVAIEPSRDAPAERDERLRKAFELGEQREKMLLAHRDWAGPDEGLYAFTNDRKLRQWHQAVKDALKIQQPSALTKESLTKP